MSEAKFKPKMRQAFVDLEQECLKIERVNSELYKAIEELVKFIGSDRQDDACYEFYVLSKAEQALTKARGIN